MTLDLHSLPQSSYRLLTHLCIMVRDNFATLALSLDVQNVKLSESCHSSCTEVIELFLSGLYKETLRHICISNNAYRTRSKNSSTLNFVRRKVLFNCTLVANSLFLYFHHKGVAGGEGGEGGQRRHLPPFLHDIS